MSSRKQSNSTPQSVIPAGVKRVRSSPELLSEEKRRVMSSDQEKLKMGEVGLMSKSQLVETMMAAMNQLLDQKLAAVASKDDVKALRDDYVKLQDENRKLREEMDSWNVKFVEQEKRLDEFDMRTRRSNCIIKGLIYKSQDNLSELISRFCIEVLNVEVNPSFIYAFPLGRNVQYNRPLKVTFLRYQDKLSVMANVKKLKYSGITIHHDLPFNIRKRRVKLLLLRKEIIRRNVSLRVSVSADRLFIQDNMFEWNMQTGLTYGIENGTKKISEIVGVDLSDFLAALASSSLPKDYFSRRQSPSIIPETSVALHESSTS